MNIARRILFIAALPALIASAQIAQADDSSAWNGTWAGSLGKSSWPVTITIAQGKVVSYLVKGAPFDIQFAEVTPTTVSFGDRDHYGVKIVKTGDATAKARVHGRLGYGYGVLTKQ